MHPHEQDRDRSTIPSPSAADETQKNRPPSSHEINEILSDGLRKNPNIVVSNISNKKELLQNELLRHRPKTVTTAYWNLVADFLSQPSVSKHDEMKKIVIALREPSLYQLKHQQRFQIAHFLQIAHDNLPSLNIDNLRAIIKILSISVKKENTLSHLLEALNAEEDRERKVEKIRRIGSLTLNEAYHLYKAQIDTLVHQLILSTSHDSTLTPLTIIDSAPIEKEQKSILSQTHLEKNKGKKRKTSRSTFSMVIAIGNMNTHLKKLIHDRPEEMTSYYETIAQTALKIGQDLDSFVREIVQISSAEDLSKLFELLSEKDFDIIQVKTLRAASKYFNIPLCDIPINLVTADYQYNKDLLHRHIESGRSLADLIRTADLISWAKEKYDLNRRQILYLTGLYWDSPTHIKARENWGILIAMAVGLEQDGKVITKNLISKLEKMTITRFKLMRHGVDENQAGNMSFMLHYGKNLKEGNKQYLDRLSLEDTNSLFGTFQKLALNRRIDNSAFFSILRGLSVVMGEPYVKIEELWRTYGIASLHTPIMSEITSKEFRELVGYHATEKDNQSLSDALLRRINLSVELRIREDLVRYLRIANKREQYSLLDKMNNYYMFDSGLHPRYLGIKRQRPNPDYVSMIRDIRAVMSGVFEMHYGSGHYTYDCRTAPGSKNWMLTEFGFDTAMRTDLLRYKDIATYPGPGCALFGIELESIFTKNTLTPDEPFSHIKEAWSWLSEELNDLTSTRFLKSRGVTAIIGADHKKYHLDGHHYSLVAFNEHFANPEKNVAVLCPTAALRKALHGYLVPIERGIGLPREELYREEGAALSFHELEKVTRDMNVPLLRLGWASNLGGLCNAYPPQSSPYFEWENSLVDSLHDAIGHVHKIYIDGSIDTNYITEEKLRLLTPLRELHQRVTALSKSYLNLDDLLRVSYSIWKKGLTPRGHGRETRMLEQAYRWHNLHKRGVTDKEAFPILTITDTWDNWSTIQTPVRLDTFDMTLTTPTFSAKLPTEAGGTGSYEYGVWQKHVRPLYIDQYDRDLRFLSRSML